MALFGIAGWQEGGGSEQLEPVSLDELERLLADDEVELLDGAKPTSGTRDTSRARVICPIARRAQRPKRGCSTAGRS